MLRPRTTILQLTKAMYETMGIADSVPCIVETEADYIETAISLGTNSSARKALREKILMNNFRLFENHSVIEEWNRLLVFVSMMPRPDISTDISTTNSSDTFSFGWVQSEYERLHRKSGHPAIMLRDVALSTFSTSTSRSSVELTVEFPMNIFQSAATAESLLMAHDNSASTNFIDIAASTSEGTEWNESVYALTISVAEVPDPIILKISRDREMYWMEDCLNLVTSRIDAFDMLKGLYFCTAIGISFALFCCWTYER